MCLCGQDWKSADRVSENPSFPRSNGSQSVSASVEPGLCQNILDLLKGGCGFPTVPP